VDRSAVLHRSLLSRRAWAALLLFLVVASSLVGSMRLDRALNLRPGPNEYNLGAWEIRNIPQKWLFLAGEFLRGAPPRESQDAHLRRFFELTREIEALQRSVSDMEQRRETVPADEAEALRLQVQERDSIENQVEATLESRLTHVAADLGLTRTFLDVVWPPIDFEFTNAPRNLITSPRDHIALRSETLLREDLTLPQLEAIENETEAKDNVSALAFPIGGLGAYPAIVDYPSNYFAALRITAHEWTHHYLFFRPLGLHYFASNDLRTINETVADLVGNEMALAVEQRWPLEETLPPASPPVNADTPKIDLGAELRSLRMDVDKLLAAGQIDEAEALMEQKRREFVDAGYNFRKINQAYFAFTNLYAGAAGSPAAVNPIGPKVDQLRRQSASLSDFLDEIGNVTSVADLDRLLLKTAKP
jgi:hypothetical protein